MFFSNVVQFSRSFAAALSSTASLLYHPLPLLSTPFLYLFSLPVPTPVCLVNSFQLIVENLCLLLFNIYYMPVTISRGYASVLCNIKGRSFLVIFKLFSPKGENLRQKVSPNFSFAMLEFSFRMLYNICHSVCACSSVDRAPASGAGCVGSIPVRRTKIPLCKSRAGFFTVRSRSFCRAHGAQALFCPRAHEKSTPNAPLTKHFSLWQMFLTLKILTYFF